MSTVTRNLPKFVKDLGVAVVGKKCYVSLVENLNINDVPCVKYAISKGLGIGIVVGGSIMKVPQMMLILDAGSAEGLSLTAYVLETLSYAITLAYSVKNNFPFSTYGENLFLTIQDILITLLIIVYAPSPRPSKSSPSPTSTKPRDLTLTLLAVAGTTYTLATLPLSTLALVQAATLPLSLFSKVPQIAQNARAGSTGQLSTIAVVAQILGCVARLFTTATEVGDVLVAAGFGLALVLNLVLGVQLWMYWGKGRAPTVGKEKKEEPIAVQQEEKEDGKTTAYESSTGSPQTVHRFATPPPRSFSPAPAQRKWARKTVD